MRLRHAVKGFQDHADDVPIHLKLEEFSRELRTYLGLNASSIELPPELESLLFKKTVDFLRTSGAVDQLKDVVKGKDQKERARLISSTIKTVVNLRKKLSSVKGQGLPMTEVLARALDSHFAKVREDLRWLYSKQDNNKMLVAGYIRPELASQFILQISDFLKRRLPQYQQKQRDEIIIGILQITHLFAGRDDALFEVVQMRRLRAIRSEEKARMKEQTQD